VGNPNPKSINLKPPPPPPPSLSSEGPEYCLLLPLWWYKSLYYGVAKSPC
jgi:hypothetical protein